MTPASPLPTPQPLSIFVSYSHRDEDLKDELVIHLATLKRQGKIRAWHDRDIEAGTEWDAEIKQQLEAAEIILLLISPRFIASDYCYDLEMQRAVQRHDAGTAQVIPIILKHCDWQDSSFSKLAILPKDAKPIAKWDDRDEAFLNVVQGIRKAVESLQTKKPLQTTPFHPPSLIPPPSHSPSPPSFSTYNPQTFTGREATIAHLTHTLNDGCRLLLIHGLTGIGKTTLSERLASDFVGNDATGTNRDLPLRYCRVTFDSRDPSNTFTRGAIAILHNLGDDTAQQLPDQQILPYLLKTLERQPCWLQLDSAEYLLHQTAAGAYHFSDPMWLDFFFTFLTASRSRIIVTSQALPVDLVERCDRYDQLWHEFSLRGLESAHWLDLFRNYSVTPQTEAETHHLCTIASTFQGHPLILKMIAGDIRKPPFNGSVEKYWRSYYSQRQTQSSLKLHQSQEDRARHWVSLTLQQLPDLPRQMLQRGAVFRRPVPESFYLEMLTDTPDSERAAALTTLKSRHLVEDTDIHNGQFLIQPHNLVRDIAYAQLEADRATWETTERTAANLWLTAYTAAPDGSNLETVRGYLEAFDHYCEVGDWEQASEIYTCQLAATNQALHWQLLIWGYYKELIEVSRKLVNHITSQTKRLCLNQIGNSYKNLGNQERAINYYQQALQFTRETGDRNGEGKALGNLGNAYDRLGQYERAIEFNQQHLTIAREIGDRQGESNALGNLGCTHESLGQYEQAIEFHQQSLMIAREIGERQGEGNTLGNLGIAYNNLGQYEQAIEFHQQSLAIAREIGDRQGESDTLGNLGIVYTKLGQYPQAINFHQQSLAIAREIGDRRGEGNALGNLGCAYERLGQYEQAIDFHQQALTISREIGSRLGEGQDLGNLGCAYEKQGDYAQAVDYAQQHLSIAREIGDKRGEGAGFRELGVALLRLESTSEALENLQVALKIFREIGSRDDEAETLKALAELHQKLGEGDLARQYCQQALAIATELGIPLQKECQKLMEDLEEKGEG